MLFLPRDHNRPGAAAHAPRHQGGQTVVEAGRDLAHVNHDEGARAVGALALAAPQASALEDIPGIGKNRMAQLLSRFGSLRALASLSPSELESVPGVGPVLARRILGALNTVEFG